MSDATENIHGRDYSTDPFPSPKKSIIEYCKNCIKSGVPIKCENTVCPLYNLRSASIPWDKGQSRNRQIRKECLDCCCGDVVSVRDCHITDCALWPYRSGRRAR